MFGNARGRDDWIGDIFMIKFDTEEKTFSSYENKSGSRQEGLKSQLEWIKRQLEYADYSEKYTLRFDLKRGEIYEIDWGINVNAEFSNRHFGVVLVDSDIFNPLVTICPLKSRHSSRINPKSDVDLGFIPELGTENSTIAVVNQIRAVDKLRLYLRRAIGTKGNSYLADSYAIEKKYTIRLNDSKLNTLLEAVKRYFNNETPTEVAKVD